MTHAPAMKAPNAFLLALEGRAPGFAVADRLAQREGKWAPFHRDGWRQRLYREPYRAVDRG